MKRFLLGFLFFLISFQVSLLAQGNEKLEYEKRIDAEEIPAPAIRFVEQLGFDKKVKWYQEFGLNSYSYEAKSKYEKKCYSIEFDSLGQVEDLEVEVAVKDMSGPAWEKVEAWLNQEFHRNKIRKVQLSFAGSEEELLSAWADSLSTEALQPVYELIVKAKTSGGYQLLECRFSGQGVLLSRKRILLRETDNLEY